MVLTRHATRRRPLHAPGPGFRPLGPPRATILPYDYAATFDLRGFPGNIVEDVITISPEGVFVAVAIGYGFEEVRGREVTIPAHGADALKDPVEPGDITLGQIPQQALIEGFCVNPQFNSLVFQNGSTLSNGAVGIADELSDQPVAASLASQLFQRVKSPAALSFLFSVIDSATGRELQDEPTHNLASLGIANGERPFRLLAQPLTFLPRSTIRLQVVEGTSDGRGMLFIVLYGYKLLASSACPEPVARSLLESASRPLEVGHAPSSAVVPFDYVARFDLVGAPGNRITREITVNVEGGFVATALGYGLLTGNLAAPLQPVLNQDNTTFDLSKQLLRAFPSDALSDGIRIRSNFLRIAFKDNGNLADSLDAGLAGQIFERLNRAEDVSFRYMISDSGLGRDWQNKPIHNIAGLGIANGQRPFKKFARPMIFQPRSTISVTVEERFGRGTLYLVFQGYKILGTHAVGGAA